MTTDETRLSGPLRWVRREAAAYRHGEQRPLGGYIALMAAYAGGTLSAAVTARAMGRRLPGPLSPWDVVQLAAATQKLSRVIAKDPVTSPVRAPFTRFEEASAPGELSEQVRGHGWKHSVGELLTCPMCLGQWVATALTLGLVFAPRHTRLAMSTMTAVVGADFLQHAYAAVQQATE